MAKNTSSSALIPQEIIENKILLIRGKRVMLDRDLAMLHGLETRVLNQAVPPSLSPRENPVRFL